MASSPVSSVIPDLSSFVQQFNELTAYDNSEDRKANEFINLVPIAEERLTPGQPPAYRVTQIRKRRNLHTKETLTEIYKRILNWVEERIQHFELWDNHLIHAPLCRLYFIAMHLNSVENLTDRIATLYQEQFPKLKPIGNKITPLFLDSPDALINQVVNKTAYPSLHYSGLHSVFYKNEIVAVQRSKDRQWHYALVTGLDEKRARTLMRYKDSENQIQSISDIPLVVVVDAGTTPGRAAGHHYFYHERVNIGRFNSDLYFSRMSPEEQNQIRIQELERMFESYIDPGIPYEAISLLRDKKTTTSTELNLFA